MNEYLGILALAVCILPALALISLLSMAGSRGNKRIAELRKSHQPGAYYSGFEEIPEPVKPPQPEPVRADMGFTSKYPQWQARFQAQQNEQDARQAQRDASHEQIVGELVNKFMEGK